MTSADNDKVVPFRRPEKAAPARPAGAPAVGRGRRLAAEQGAEDRDRYARAANRQETARLLATGRPVPARITMALDLRGLDGPGVDIACGTVEPYVDLWECGLEVPTAEQVRLLAELTQFPVRYFYLPIKPGPALGGGPIFMCGPRKCEVIAAHVIDEHGVLHHNGIPRIPPPGWQGHLF